MRKPLIAGNWKMHKTVGEAETFALEFMEKYGADDSRGANAPEVAVCAPYLQLRPLVQKFSGSGVIVGAQNMHFEDKGAFTGEISAPMLKDAGIECCIIGHSERREYFGETDETVNKKLKTALAYGIRPILCVGENLEMREAGRHMEIVEAQLKADFEGIPAEEGRAITIAYEPLWAIGTGRTASSEQAQEMAAFIREAAGGIYSKAIADEMIILYGGSVKPGNIRELMAMEDIDGALVGGASLNVEDFIRLVDYWK